MNHNDCNLEKENLVDIKDGFKEFLNVECGINIRMMGLIKEEKIHQTFPVYRREEELAPRLFYWKKWLTKTCLYHNSVEIQLRNVNR